MATRRPAPGFLLVAGLVCAALAGAGWAIRTTITDERKILDEAFTIARSEPVREEFAWQIADAIAPHATETSPAELTRANEIARQAVETPAFEQAFASALPAVYQRVVNGTTTEVVLDPALIQQAIASTGTVPPTVVLRVSSTALPDLRQALEVMDSATAALAALALLLICIGIALSPHRGRAVMRIGRWLITAGVLTIVAFWALPTLALLPLGGWISVIGIVLATGDWLVVPALMIAAFGIAIVVLGRAGESGARRRELSVIPHHPGRTPTRPGMPS